MSARLREIFASYLQQRIVVMLALGFSSGLPFLLVFGTLSAWLRQVGVSRTAIGVFSYVGLSYAFKFLWAPLVDQVKLPLIGDWLGKRRAWILAAQSLTIVCLVAISLCDPARMLMTVAVFAVALAFASATQDICIDAWRIEAAQDQRTMATAYQLGYRLALIAAGAGTLVVAQHASWPAAYLTMAGLMGAGIVTTLLAPRPEDAPEPVIGERTVETLAGDLHIRGVLMRALEWIYRAAVAPFVDFFAKHGWNALFILAFVGTYRLSDFVMGVMASNTFYIDLGYSLEIIAAVVKFAGIWMTILGVMVGGLALMRFGTTRALLIGIVAAIVANLAYAWLGTRHGSVPSLAIALGTENFASGFAGTALIAYMSGLTSHAFTATQYALFSSFYALPGKLLGGMSGWTVDWFTHHASVAAAIAGQNVLAAGGKAAGYVPFFVCTAALSLPALALVLIMLRRERLSRPV
ncbi:MAG: MFS transporter [Alphaproteobacteria bacterium]|nr:MFS transporter [Alphaproteobacteria bacterium]MDE2629764.1 MFS transporter [Alphaproteobacteria bacterium]